MNIYKSNDGVKAFMNFLDEGLMAVVYDLETTGLKPAIHRIIQVTARLCAVSPYGLDEICNQTWYINPGCKLPEKIVSLTGITDELLADKPKEYEVLPEIVDFFGHYPVVGYNNQSFDDVFMQMLYERYGYTWAPDDSIDVYALVRCLMKPNETKNQKLMTMAEYFGVADQIERFHNADADTMATLLVANHCIERCAEQEEVTSGTVKCKVTGIRYWENPKNWKMRRLYVDTDISQFYFDMSAITWNPVFVDDLISQYDMPDLIKQVLVLTGCRNEGELSHYKGAERT